MDFETDDGLVPRTSADHVAIISTGRPGLGPDSLDGSPTASERETEDVGVGEPFPFSEAESTVEAPEDEREEIAVGHEDRRQRTQPRSVFHSGHASFAGRATRFPARKTDVEVVEALAQAVPPIRTRFFAENSLREPLVRLERQAEARCQRLDRIAGPGERARRDAAYAGVGQQLGKSLGLSMTLESKGRARILPGSLAVPNEEDLHAQLARLHESHLSSVPRASMTG